MFQTSFLKIVYYSFLPAIGKGSTVVLPAGREHFLQLDHDGHHNLFVLRLVEVDAAAVMYRDHFLPDGRNGFTALVEQHEIQPDHVALELPAQPLDVGDISDDVEKLVGHGKLLLVRHSDIVLFVEADRLFLQMRHRCAGGVENICFAFQGKDRGFRVVQRLPLLVLNLDLLVQVSGIQLRVERAGRPYFSTSVSLGPWPALWNL